MKSWLRKKFSTLVKWFQPKYKTEYKEELPEVMEDRTIYLIGQPDNPWLVTLKCPCGCNCIIHLNLLEDAEPCWSFKLTAKKRINISPSVRRTMGCGSHFFVRGSKIEWAGYSARIRF